MTNSQVSGSSQETELQEFNLEQFQEEVLSRLAEEMQDTLDTFSIQDSWENKQRRQRRKEEEAVKRINSLKEAEFITRKTEFKNLICPALQSITGDVFDIAKITTPALVVAVSAKTISIPLDPLIFMYIAIVIARAGVSSFCASCSTRK